MRSAIAILLLLVSSAALASPSGGGGGGSSGGGGSHGGGGGGGGHATAGGAHSGDAHSGGASRTVASHGGLGYYGGLSSLTTGRLGTHIVLGNNTAASRVAERDRRVAPPKPNPPNLSWWRHRHDHGWLESNAPMWVPPIMCSEGQRLLGHCVGEGQRAAARR